MKKKPDSDLFKRSPEAIRQLARRAHAELRLKKRREWARQHPDMLGGAR